MNVLAQFKAARRVSAPLIIVNTPDVAATISRLGEAVNGKSPVFSWDFVKGLRLLNQQVLEALAKSSDPLDHAAVSEIAKLLDQDTQFNPGGMIMAAEHLPRNSVLFIQNAHRYLEDDGVVQGIVNLRDELKCGFRTLVLLGPQVPPPAEIASDVIVLEEELPEREQIETIIRDVHDAVEMEPEQDAIGKAIRAMQGLSAFQIEQTVAMSLTPDGMVLDDLQERKRRLINLTKGLDAYMGGSTFADIYGCEAIKARSLGIINGREPVDAIVWLDEGEKALAGAGTDTSGVADDQLGTLLTEMEEQHAIGFIFVGHAGTAKSAMAKAIGGEAEVPTIRCDLGAMQGSLVGQSQAALRQALKVIKAVSNGRALWIMTCNDITKLPPALLRRFRSGIYFFDLPTAPCREGIWNLYLSDLIDVDVDPKSFDEGWTGAEIEQCVRNAYRERMPISASRHTITPQCVIAADSVDRLRQLAHRRFLSAEHPGMFELQDRKQQATRSIDLEQ